MKRHLLGTVSLLTFFVCIFTVANRFIESGSALVSAKQEFDSGSLSADEFNDRIAGSYVATAGATSTRWFHAGVFLSVVMFYAAYRPLAWRYAFRLVLSVPLSVVVYVSIQFYFVGDEMAGLLSASAQIANLESIVGMKSTAAFVALFTGPFLYELWRP